MKLKDKVAIITGAAGGIGAAFALGYAKEGAKIVIGDLRDGKETVHAVEEAGSEAIFVKTDVSKQEECDVMAKAAVDRFGAIDLSDIYLYYSHISNFYLSDGMFLLPSSSKYCK